MVVVEMVGTGGGTCSVCVSVVVLTVVDTALDVDGGEGEAMDVAPEELDDAKVESEAEVADAGAAGTEPGVYRTAVGTTVWLGLGGGMPDG